MSESSDLTAAAESIHESLTGTLDADELESVLDGDASLRSAGRELGGDLGGELGAILGRELGAVVATDALEREDPRTILSDVVRRLLELLAALLRNADIEAGVSRLREFGADVVSGETPGELLDTVVPGEENDEGEDEAGTGSDESEQESDAEADDVEDVEEDTDSETSAADLREMREETYRELLEVMSYRELQSIAKEVGVKANLGQEEMTERIIQEFSEE